MQLLDYKYGLVYFKQIFMIKLIIIDDCYNLTESQKNILASIASRRHTRPPSLIIFIKSNNI